MCKSCNFLHKAEQGCWKLHPGLSLREALKKFDDEIHEIEMVRCPYCKGTKRAPEDDGSYSHCSECTEDGWVKESRAREIELGKSELVKARVDEGKSPEQKGAARARRNQRSVKPNTERGPAGGKLRSFMSRVDRAADLRSGVPGKKGEKITGEPRDEKGVHVRSGDYARQAAMGGKGPNHAARIVDRNSPKGERDHWRTPHPWGSKDAHLTVMQQQKEIKPKLDKSDYKLIERARAVLRKSQEAAPAAGDHDFSGDDSHIVHMAVRKNWRGAESLCGNNGMNITIPPGGFGNSSPRQELVRRIYDGAKRSFKRDRVNCPACRKRLAE